MSDDPYAALGLKKTATAGEIKKAYRKIARNSHPDLNPDDTAAEARFKAASAAYDLLKDPETRARFDRGEIDATGAERPERHFYREYAQRPDSPYGPGPQFDSSAEAADIFAEFLRQRGQYGGQYGGRQSAGPGAAGGAQGFSAPGPDRHYTLEVPFMDAVNGAKTRITLPGGGALEVQIPEGTADGQTIRLRGKGGPGFGGGPPGNALVTITVRPHAFFRREGNDILVTLPISIDEAILGGKVEVATITGKVKVNIPKGASSGQVLRLRGRGVRPASGGKARGDQKVELRIVAPPKIDDELAGFMKNWRKTHAYDPRRGMKT